MAAEIREETSEQLGFQILSAMYTGTRQLATRTEMEITTPADLEGLKLRMIGSESYQFLGRALGANPTPLAYGEIYLALKTGTIDAQDNPLTNFYAMKFYEVSDQVILTGHLVQDVLIGASNHFWETLDDTDKEIFEEAAEIAAEFTTRNALRDERTLIERLKGLGVTFTEPDVEAFREHVREAYMSDERSEIWPEGMWQAIQELQPDADCRF